MPNPIAVCETTVGTFRAEIFLDKMPISASNFIDLAQTGFYNGIHFHRVIPKFMNQFGCPKAKNANAPDAGTGGPAPGSEYKNLGTGKMMKRNREGCIQDELITKISNEPGTFSMANTGSKDTGGSQFFINVAHNNFLDWFDKSSPSEHPVFGRVCSEEDLKLMVQISNVPSKDDNPKKPIMMKSITIEGL